ncbi:MAG: sulfite exporter TauE/SafE family protein [Neisseria sp.]|nr:sulfite exporter TauE/SafE family protein [Neisseria sp.]
METALIPLLITGFAAGLMDAAVGGGGLLQIPALFGILPANTPLAAVLGINKFAAATGTSVAAAQFALKIRVPWKLLLPAAAIAFTASYLGAKLASNVPANHMKPAIFIIMTAMFAYTFRKKDLGQTVRETALNTREYRTGLLFGALIGFYDGILGPGTGSLLSFAFVRFFAFDFLTASASAKIINLATNLAALCYFAPNGHIVWQWALPLAAANLLGGIAGSALAIRGGAKFLRQGFMFLLLVLIGKFGLDIFMAAK